MPAPQHYGGTIAPGEGVVPAAPPRPAAQPITDIPLAHTGTHILVAAETPAPDKAVEAPQVPQAEEPATTAEVFPFPLAGAPESQPAVAVDPAHEGAEKSVGTPAPDQTAETTTPGDAS